MPTPPPGIAQGSSVWGLGPEPAAPSKKAGPQSQASPVPAASRFKVRIGGVLREGTCDAEGVIVLDGVEPRWFNIGDIGQAEAGAAGQAQAGVAGQAQAGATGQAEAGAPGQVQAGAIGQAEAGTASQVQALPCSDPSNPYRMPFRAPPPRTPSRRTPSPAPRASRSPPRYQGTPPRRPALANVKSGELACSRDPLPCRLQKPLSLGPQAQVKARTVALYRVNAPCGSFQSSVPSLKLSQL